MNKVYFWLKERMWRILLWSMMVYFTMAAFGESGSYFDAFFNFLFMWTLQYLGSLAFAEENLYLDRKLAKEIADRLEMK